LKGFKKDGKFRPTGKRNKSSLTKADLQEFETELDKGEQMLGHRDRLKKQGASSIQHDKLILEQKKKLNKMSKEMKLKARKDESIDSVINKVNEKEAGIRDEIGIAHDVDASTLITEPLHEDNPTTKKEIFENVSDDHIDSMKFAKESFPELEWQDLDPRLNKFNSVRYQMIKNSGHYLGEDTRPHRCKYEDCEHIQTESIIYYVTFNDEGRKSISSDRIKPNDTKGIGVKGSPVGHLFEAHSDETHKQLAKMQGGKK